MHLRAISQEVHMNLIHNICSKIIPLNLLPHLPWANELIHGHIVWQIIFDGLVQHYSNSIATSLELR